MRKIKYEYKSIKQKKNQNATKLAIKRALYIVGEDFFKQTNITRIGRRRI